MMRPGPRARAFFHTQGDHMRIRWIPSAPATFLTFALSSGFNQSAAQFVDRGLDAQIVIYISVPERVREDVTLDVGAVTVVGRAATIALEPVRRELRSTRVAGRPVRFVDQPVPSGRYEFLNVVFDGAGGRIGPARVRPQVPDSGIAIGLDLDVRTGESAFLLLQWTPHAIEPDSAVYTPRFELMVPEVGPAGSLAFVSNEGSGNISVVDRFSLSVVDVLMVGAEPRGMAYSERDQQLYVAVAAAHEIVVLNALSRQAIRRVPLRYGDEPTRLLLSDSEEEIHVLNYGSNVLTTLAVSSLQEISRVAVGERPRAMAAGGVGGYLYVTSELSSRILVYDPTTGSQENSIAVESPASEVLFDGGAEQLFVSSATQGRLTVLGAQSGELVARLDLCSPAASLAYNPVSRRLYAAAAACREIAVFRPEQALEIGVVELPDRPGRMAFDADGRQLLVPLPLANQLAVYNANSADLSGIVEVGEKPYEVVVP